jgi:two-component system, sensor histidine kinase and response regulator
MATDTFNETELLERILDDRELARTLLQCFVEDFPRQYHALRTLLDNADGSGIVRQTHTMKGAAASVSGPSMTKVTAELERAARAGDLPAVRAGLPELQRQFILIKLAIESSSLFRG